MKYLLLSALAVSFSAFGATERYRVETHIKVEGRKVSASKVSVKAGRKAVVAQCDPAGKLKLIKISSMKPDESPCGEKGEVITGMEVTAQKDSQSRAGKLRIDLKFIGAKIGNSRQKIVAMPDEETSIMYYNNKGEMVEARVVARRL
jgi:hypothetical protein